MDFTRRPRSAHNSILMIFFILYATQAVQDAGSDTEQVGLAEVFQL